MSEEENRTFDTVFVGCVFDASGPHGERHAREIYLREDLVEGILSLGDAILELARAMRPGDGVEPAEDSGGEEFQHTHAGPEYRVDT